MQGPMVFLIVAAAAGYAGWLLMPQGMRRWLVRRLMAVAPSRSTWLARLEANAEAGGCSSCKGCAAGGRPPVRPGPARIELHRRSRQGERDRCARTALR